MSKLFNVITTILAILVAAGCVTVLVPQVYWVEAKFNGTTTYVSLWQTCIDQPSSLNHSITNHTCGGINGFHFNNIKTAATAERDGAIAGQMLGGLLAVVSLITLWCQSKWGTIILLSLATLGLGASVGCFVRYKIDTLDKEDNAPYSFTYGFMGACGAFGVAFFAVVSACMMSKKHSDYYSIA